MLEVALNVQLTVIQLGALVADGLIAMVLTVLLGILVNNSTGRANHDSLKSDMQRVEGTLRSELQRFESALTSKIRRVEGG